jgi:hypothetical protein
LACAALAAAFAWQAAAVSAQPAAAQKPKAAAPTRPAGESDADALMRARVLDVLRQTAGESKDWADASATSSVQARAADSMWEADPAAGRGLFDDRSERSAVLLQMAMGVVKDDPRAAAHMATESLRDGISFGLQSVLVALQESRSSWPSASSARRWRVCRRPACRTRTS